MHILEKVVNKLALINPWTNVYGVARTLLAFGTTLTFVFNDVDILFRPIIESGDKVMGVGVSKASIFYLLNSNLSIAKIISIIILLIVISGWRPKITGLFHWWISFSFMTSCAIVDGGDHLTAVLTFLLLPVCLTDRRKWHWSLDTTLHHSISVKIAAIIAVSCLIVTRLQVAIVYLNSGIAKLNVTEWANGTALYYWMQNPIIGLSDGLKILIIPLLSTPFVVTMLTWGVILLEIIFFTALVVDKKYWSTLLKVGLIFHFGIVVAHGLVTFFFAMAAALILYLRPIDLSFTNDRIFKMLIQFNKMTNLLNQKRTESIEKS